MQSFIIVSSIDAHLYIHLDTLEQANEIESDMVCESFEVGSIEYPIVVPVVCVKMGLGIVLN